MLDRTQAPLQQRLPSLTIPVPDQVAIADEVSLLGITGVQQEVVKIDWVFDGGRWQETARGASHFTSLLLDKGTPRESAAAIAARLEGMGAHLETSAGADFFFVSLYALTKNWQTALAVVTEILREATFPEDELALQKSITLENIRVNKEKTSYLAGQAIRSQVFGATHPYGSSLEADDVAELERSQLQAFHQRHFRLIQVFATVPHAAHLHQLADALGDLHAPPAGAPVAHPVAPGALVQHIAKAGSVQNSIRLGKRTIGRAHADYSGLLLVNHLLGGFFGSRLMKNIREQKGLTYGIHSALQPHLHDCMWIVSADVNNANRDLALAEIRSEMHRLCGEPVSPDELEVCKNHFLGSLVADVATPFSVMGKVRTLYLNRLPSDYYEKLFAEVNAIGPARFNEIANRYLTGDWHQVSVG